MGLDLILPRKSSSANNRGASNGAAKTSSIQGAGLSKGVSPVDGVSKTTQVADFSANVPLRPKITVIGVGGGGGNAVRNMIASHLLGVDFVVANTDAQALELTECEYRVQLGETLTGGLGAGARPEVGRQAAEDSKEEIQAAIADSNMVFVTAGMGGGTGTGAAPIVAKVAKELGILTVGVVTKPFSFEGRLRMQVAEKGIAELRKYVDTMIVIPNQNLFKLAKDDTPMTVAMAMADNVLYQGVAGITDLMLVPGIINLDFADIRTAMSEMGTAVLGTGEAEGSDRAKKAAELATSNPLLDDLSIKGARSLLINITSGEDLTIHEVNDAVDTITKEVHESATIIYGHSVCNGMNGKFRVSIVATGIDSESDVEDTGSSGFADKDTYSIKPSRNASENVRQEFSARRNMVNDTATTQGFREANNAKMNHSYNKANVRANKVESHTATTATKNYNSKPVAEKELYLDDNINPSKMFVNDKPIASPTNSYGSVALKNNYHHSVVDNNEDEEIDIVKQAFDDEGYIQSSGSKQQDELFELIGDDYSENLLPEENQNKLTNQERDIKYRLRNIKSNEQDSIFSQILSFASSKSKKNSINNEERIVSTTKNTDVNPRDKVNVQSRDVGNKDESKKNEGLEIPSFLRRQAN